MAKSENIRENFEAYTSDQKCHDTFLEYLAEDNLDFTLKFRITIIGLKKDLKENEDPGIILKILKAVYKKFFKKSENGFNFSTLPGFPEEFLQEISEAVKQKKFETSMYDKSFNFVTEFLKNRCFPNFLKSEIFISSLVQQEKLSDSLENEAEKSEGNPKEKPKEIAENSVKVLQNIPEEKELKIENRPYINQFNPYKDADMEREKLKLNYFSKFDASGPTQSKAHIIDSRSLPRGFNKEKHTKNYGQIDEHMPVKIGRENAAPYHATSSTMNFVSKQNSNFTDNSSTFSSGSLSKRVPKRIQEQPDLNIAPIGFVKNGSDEARMSRRMATLATKSPPEFFQILKEKLEVLELEILKHENFREWLRRSHYDRMSNPSESVVGVREEKDEDLLDDHMDFFQQENEEVEKRDKPDGITVISNKSGYKTLPSKWANPNQHGHSYPVKTLERQKAEYQQQQRYYEQTAARERQKFEQRQKYEQRQKFEQKQKFEQMQKKKSYNAPELPPRNNVQRYHHQSNWSLNQQTWSSSGGNPFSEPKTITWAWVKINQQGKEKQFQIKLEGSQITLGSFKSQLPMSDPSIYSYWFLTSGFGRQLDYFRESKDNAILPLIDGIIQAKIVLN